VVTSGTACFGGAVAIAGTHAIWPMLPIMVETAWTTMLFRCADCECSDDEARAMVAEDAAAEGGAI